MIRIIISLALSLTFTFPISAKIYRINNTPGSDAPYSDFKTAHALAANGDTIYVEGSNKGYGDFAINKRLMIIGPGYFLNENPNTPVSLPAFVRMIYLYRTSSNDPFSGAAGTEIIGLSITQSAVGTASMGIRVEVSDVIISKCEISTEVRIPVEDVSGIQIFQNYFHGSGLTGSNGILVSSGLNNFTFSNNIVLGSFRIPDNSTGGIFHNLFLGNAFNVEFFTGEIRSNIATSSNVINFKVFSTGVGQVSHNTAASGQFGDTDDNNAAPPNQLFVENSGNSTDGKYQLLPTAPAAKNNAHDGTDRGPFGGSRPYSLSGLGHIPAIIYLAVPASGTPSEPFIISIRAISGN